jgi:RNase P/RNase MRP subunit p29
MNLARFSRVSLLGAGVLCVTFATSAQVNTKTNSSPVGAPTKTVKVERGEVVYVSGNNLVVKAEDGTLRHFDNVPDSKTVTVDGQQLNVHQLKPGMKLERQTITTTVPKMITTVKTVTGTVWQVSPPTSVILTLEDGKNQRFNIPKGQKFTVNGQVTDAFGLRKGMRIDAQQVIEQPETEVMLEVKRTGTMPPPPPPIQPDVPILVLVLAPAAPVETASAAPTEAAPTKLPKTGTYLPMIGLLGALLVALGLGLKVIRTRNA